MGTHTFMVLLITICLLICCGFFNNNNNNNHFANASPIYSEEQCCALSGYFEDGCDWDQTHPVTGGCINTQDIFNAHRTANRLPTACQCDKVGWYTIKSQGFCINGGYAGGECPDVITTSTFATCECDFMCSSLYTAHTHFLNSSYYVFNHYTNYTFANSTSEDINSLPIGGPCVKPGEESNFAHFCADCRGCTYSQSYECGAEFKWYALLPIQRSYGYGTNCSLSSSSSPSSFPQNHGVIPNTCTKMWSFSPYELQTTAHCPLEHTNCRGGCSANVTSYLYCIEAVVDNIGGLLGYQQVSNDLCSTSKLSKPSFTIRSCQPQLSLSSTGRVIPPPPSTAPCPLLTYNTTSYYPSTTDCGVECAANNNLTCVLVPDGTDYIVRPADLQTTCGLRSKWPSWGPTSCTYAWSLDPVEFIPIENDDRDEDDTLKCPYCGGCDDLNKDITCFRNHSSLGYYEPVYGINGNTTTSTSISFCGDEPKPIYANITTKCNVTWSGGSTQIGQFVIPLDNNITPCPTNTTCGKCIDDNNVVCVEIDLNTNIVLQILDDDECYAQMSDYDRINRNKPWYKSNICELRCVEYDEFDNQYGVDCSTYFSNNPQECGCDVDYCTFWEPKACWNTAANTFYSDFKPCIESWLYETYGWYNVTGISAWYQYMFFSTNPPTFSYQTNRSEDCTYTWSYNYFPPYDTNGACLSRTCSTTCPTPLNTWNMRCLYKNITDIDVADWQPVSNNICYNLNITQPTEYKPYDGDDCAPCLTCQWGCLSNRTDFNFDNNNNTNNNETNYDDYYYDPEYGQPPEIWTDCNLPEFTQCPDDTQCKCDVHRIVQCVEITELVFNETAKLYPTHRGLCEATGIPQPPEIFTVNPLAPC